jgi:uncharacterized protein
LSIFLLTFFLVYGGVHAYFFVKAKGALGLGLPAATCLALFLMLMLIAPILVHVVERGGNEPAARTVAYAGYFWMGFLFFFFCVSLTTDLYRVAFYVASHLSRSEFSRFCLTGKVAFLFASCCAVAACFYGYFEAAGVHTERILIKSAKIPASVGRITLVQVSDVHLGLIVRRERLLRLINKIIKANPDILVSTGDLVDGQIDGLGELAAELRRIKPKYGKYAVTGNHEFYAGLDQALDFTRKSGFTILRGETALVGGCLAVAGMDDQAGPGVGRSASGENDILERVPRNHFSVVLRHRPIIRASSLGHFDLQLSGHVHKGQMFPFNLVTFMFYPVRTGYTYLGRGSALYVSRGSGTWGPPMRFLAPPEMTVIVLENDRGGD